MFSNRQEAAERLAGRLASYKGRNPLVLAIPRGGVPMGRVVADALEGELDVVLVHKLGAPGNPEFAIGAVDETGQVQLGSGAQLLGVGSDYVGQESRKQVARLRQRRERYQRPPADPAGRIVIVVDDGVATGATLGAALQALRARQPARLIAAIGVAPPEAAEGLAPLVDEWVCLSTPTRFYAVGQFFSDFSQVTDDDVIALLDRQPVAAESEEHGQ